MNAIEALRTETLEANLEIARQHLVLYTFGNASGISREEGVVAIKPSGMPFAELRSEHMVLTDMEGKILEGSLRPSSDLPTHLALYKAFPAIGGVVHTHSEFATAWAQARRPIPCLGTTHADYFHGPIPVTESLEPHEIESAYEENTGLGICRIFKDRDPDVVPAVLVAGHAPFCWGRTPADAVHRAVVLEAVARMAYYTLQLAPEAAPIPRHLHDKHYLRKHGSDAYYGQPKEPSRG